MLLNVVNTGTTTRLPHKNTEMCDAFRAKRWTSAGVHKMGNCGPGYRLCVDKAPKGCCAFRLERMVKVNKYAPVVGCAASRSKRTAGVLWQSVEREYLSLTDRYPWSTEDYAIPKRPKRVPWICMIVFDLDEFERKHEWLIGVCYSEVLASLTPD